MSRARLIVSLLLILLLPLRAWAAVSMIVCPHDAMPAAPVAAHASGAVHKDCATAHAESRTSGKCEHCAGCCSLVAALPAFFAAPAIIQQPADFTAEDRAIVRQMPQRIFHPPRTI
jgi:hypothetical protein